MTAQTWERKGETRVRYVVIGTSAGGAEALVQLFKDLPADFPAAVLVVMHVGENRPMDWLADRLVVGGRLPVRVARDGETICQGVGYLAPANTHLLIEGERISLGHSAREQHARPAIDVLFRSAAAEWGERAIGVILTGMLSDGTRGLRAIHDAGGITIVQEPSDAAHGDMPRNAMRDLDVDYCVKLSAIAPLLDLLVRRAGSRGNRVLETGLASSVRFLRERAAMLSSLHEQSAGNTKTARFLADELAALKGEIEDIQRLIAGPAKRDRQSASRAAQGAARAKRTRS